MGSMSLQDQNFMILDPLNLQNNTTKNSYHTGHILKQFQSAYNNLKSLIMKRIAEAKTSQVSNRDREGGLSSGIAGELQQQHSQLEPRDFVFSGNQTKSQSYSGDIHAATADIDKKTNEGNTILSEGMYNRGNNNNSNSITLSDAIMNIEVIRRGNLEKFLSNLDQSSTLDLGIDDLTIQQEQKHKSMPAMLIVSQLQTQQLQFYANFNLLETFFAKDTQQEAKGFSVNIGDVNFAKAGESNVTSLGAEAVKGSNAGQQREQ